MAIATLTSNETGANSLTDINANFVDLDTTKADLASPTFTGTPSLPTGTTAVTQSANDNSTKVATTAYADNATARTCLTVTPKPNWLWGTGTTQTTDRVLGTNTTMLIGQVVIPFSITANKVSFRVGAVGVAGTAKIALYSEDGQTKTFEVTTASISGTGALITSLSSPTLINAGVYYIAILPVGTTSINLDVYANPGTASANVVEGVTSEPVLNGTVTVTASTIPSTITPASITAGSTNSYTLLFRLDN